MAHAFVTQNRVRGRIPFHERCAVYVLVAIFRTARVGIDVAALVNVTSGELTGARIVTVHGSAAGFAQEIAIGRHRLTGDEPPLAGGTDAGPNPYDFLLAALGTCVSMTVAMYARRKRWPLDAVTVRLRHSRIHAAHCEYCETTDGLLDHIDCDVELTGVLSEEQHVRLLEIAEKCPVHRTLTSAIHIQTRLTRRDEDPLPVR